MQIILYTISGKVSYKILKSGHDQIFDHEIPAWEDAAEAMYSLIIENKEHLEKIKEVFSNAPIRSIDFDDCRITNVEPKSYYDIALRTMFEYVCNYFFNDMNCIEPYSDLHMKCNIGRIINSVYDQIEINIV